MSTQSQRIKVQNRFVFTITKDIELLKLCLQHNPWQLGSKNWTNILEACKEREWKLSMRTIKNRINLLVEQKRKEELSFMTGTEEQLTERGELLNEVEAILVQSSASINLELGADSESQLENVILVDESSEIGHESINSKNKTEKFLADKERDEILEESVPSPCSSRGKKQKISFKDELIKQRQDHEIEIENKRLRLEEKKIEYDMEKELRTYELEKIKENRKLEENKRKDEIMIAQLEIQKNILALLQELKK